MCTWCGSGEGGGGGERVTGVLWLNFNRFLTSQGISLCTPKVSLGSRVHVRINYNVMYVCTRKREEGSGTHVVLMSGMWT